MTVALALTLALATAIAGFITGWNLQAARLTDVYVDAARCAGADPHRFEEAVRQHHLITGRQRAGGSP